VLTLGFDGGAPVAVGLVSLAACVALAWAAIASAATAPEHRPDKRASSRHGDRA
jgi:hypothetical protein